jgi:hypothetical protein
MWSAVDAMWRKAAQYEDGKEGLRPDRPVFWSSDAIAVYNSKGMWQAVKEARVTRDEIASVEGQEVLLESGERLRCDAIVACTGWSNCYPMFDLELAKKLGLPLLPGDEDVDQATVWEDRIKTADKHVVDAFPKLADQPKYPDHKPKSTPSRLYQAMIPIEGDDTHSIAFMGTVGTTQSFTVAEVQSLWVAAYLDNKIQLPSHEDMEASVALATAWRRRRYLGDGYTFLFEQLQVSECNCAREQS